MANFDIYSNYNENTSFSSIVFGAEKPVFEVEMNGLQQIVSTKIARILKAIGSCVLPLSDTSLVFNKDSKVLNITDSVVLDMSGLTAYVKSAQVTLSSSKPYAYFVMEEVEATRETELKEYGNTAGDNIENHIQDSRSPIETTRRKLIKYTLMSGASVPSNTDTLKYVGVGYYNTNLGSFVDEYKITPIVDLGLSVNESGEMCVTYEE